MIVKYSRCVARVVRHLEHDSGGYSDLRLLRLLSHLSGVDSCWELNPDKVASRDGSEPGDRDAERDEVLVDGSDQGVVLARVAGD